MTMAIVKKVCTILKPENKSQVIQTVVCMAYFRGILRIMVTKSALVMDQNGVLTRAKFGFVGEQQQQGW